MQAAEVEYLAKLGLEDNYKAIVMAVLRNISPGKALMCHGLLEHGTQALEDAPESKGGRAPLPEAVREEIVRLRKSGATYADIGLRLGVATSTAHLICEREGFRTYARKVV